MLKFLLSLLLAIASSSYIEYCDELSASQGGEESTCDQCSDNFVLADEGLSCSCPQGTELDDSCGECVSPIPFCSEAECGECTKCDKGYHLNNAQTSCLANIPFCTTYDDANCDVCQKNYALVTNSSGIKICIPEVKYCQTYNVAAQKCKSCQQLRELSKNGLSCPCKTGYHENNEGYCIKDVPYCTKYYGDGTCKTCQGDLVVQGNVCKCPTSYTQEDDQCVLAVSYCQSYNSKKTQCVKCKSGYYVSNNKCWTNSTYYQALDQLRAAQLFSCDICAPLTQQKACELAPVCDWKKTKCQWADDFKKSLDSLSKVTCAQLPQDICFGPAPDSPKTKSCYWTNNKCTPYDTTKSCSTYSGMQCYGVMNCALDGKNCVQNTCENRDKDSCVRGVAYPKFLQPNFCYVKSGKCATLNTSPTNSTQCAQVSPIYKWDGKKCVACK